MLLFDEHLSRHLIPRLADAFPGCTQVALVGLDGRDDRDVWEYAKTAGLTIVTKDADFLNTIVLLGPPPKVILLQVGNGPTTAIELLLRTHAAQITEFCRDCGRGILILH